jgi:hypothetical protein
MPDHTQQQRVRLKTFSTLAEAQIVRARLEANGIESFIPNEMITQMYPIPSIMGQIYIEVAEIDLKHALLALEADE